MKRGGATATITAAILAATYLSASATSFTMTTEGGGDSVGFIDTDTMTKQGEIGKVTAYTVWKVDTEVPAAAKAYKAAAPYAAGASEIWFECQTRHYSIVRLFFYSNRGQFVGSYDKPVLVDQPVPPQTGLEEQYNYVCTGAMLKNRINKFNDLETPLQTLIRAARATLNDPRYVP